MAASGSMAAYLPALTLLQEGLQKTSTQRATFCPNLCRTAAWASCAPLACLAICGAVAYVGRGKILAIVIVDEQRIVAAARHLCRRQALHDSQEPWACRWLILPQLDSFPCRFPCRVGCLATFQLKAQICSSPDAA